MSKVRYFVVPLLIGLTIYAIQTCLSRSSLSPTDTAPKEPPMEQAPIKNEQESSTLPSVKPANDRNVEISQPQSEPSAQSTLPAVKGKK